MDPEKMENLEIDILGRKGQWKKIAWKLCFCHNWGKIMGDPMFNKIDYNLWRVIFVNPLNQIE